GVDSAVFVPERLALTFDTTPMVNNNGAVSPAARATASIAPLTMPGRADGSTIPSVVRHVRAPIAALASRRLFGTSRSISSVVRTTMGSIRQASASAPANADCLYRRTHTVYTNRPITID